MYYKTSFVFLVAVLVILNINSGCKSLTVTPESNLKKVFNGETVKSGIKSIGIKSFKTNDIYLRRLFNDYLGSLEKRKDINIIRDYAAGNQGKVDIIAEFELGNEYLFNRAKSIFIAFPGNFILMPSWNGLSYTMVVRGSIKTFDTKKNQEREEYYFYDHYTINHSTAARIAACYTIGFYVPFSFLAGAFSDWDDDMKESTVLYLKDKGYFNEIMKNRLFEAISNN